MVVFTHGYSHVLAAQGPKDGLFHFIGQFGYAGVDIFFIISGFIIWHTTSNSTGFSKIPSFIYKRMARIYTGYWPYFIVACIIFWLKEPDIFDRVDIWASFFLYNYRIPELIIPASWSLAYELYFYLIFSALLLLPISMRFKTVIVLFISISIIQVWALLVMETYEESNYKKASEFIRFFASPFFLEFLAGCILAATYKKINISCRWLFIAAVVLCAAGIYVQDHVVQDSLMKGYYRMWRVPFFGISAFFIVWLVLQLESNGKVFFKEISIALGNISYSIYLSHTLIFATLYYAGISDFLKERGQSEIWYIFIVFVIIIYSAIHYYYIERPFRYFSLEFINKKTLK